MRRSDVQVFEGVSDVTPVQDIMSDEELFDLCSRRYTALGRPEERLVEWLDAHRVPRGNRLLHERVMALPKEGLISLAGALNRWRLEKEWAR